MCPAHACLIALFSEWVFIDWCSFVTVSLPVLFHRYVLILQSLFLRCSVFICGRTIVWWALYLSKEHLVLMFSGSFTGFHIFFPFYRQCSVMHNFECLMVVTGMHSYLVLGHQFHKIFFSYCQRKLSNSKWLGPMGMTYLILRWWPKFPSKRSVKAFNHSAHLWSLQNKGAFHLTWSNMIKTVWQIYALRHVVPADVNT